MLRTQLHSRKTSRFIQWPLLCAAVLAGVSAGPVAQAQTVLLEDNFDNSKLNGQYWGVADDGWSLHRTRFGLAPLFVKDESGRYARFRLNTYSPSDAKSDPNPGDGISNYFQGAQIFSKEIFKMGTGVEFEARIRGTRLTPGMVMAFFTFSEQGSSQANMRRDEIDLEMITTRPVNEAWNHIWNDWNPNYGYEDGVHDWTKLPVVSGWNRNEWSTYKIRWLNDRIECYINGVLARSETKILPDHPMGLFLNIWVPDSTWTFAYDGALQPFVKGKKGDKSGDKKADKKNKKGKGETYYMDVDYVKVTSIAPPAGAVVGTGDGLSATYFSNPDLTGSTISRIEPRVNFDWTPYFPEPTLGQGTYSARWVGQVQAQYSQAYTFYTQADDGVRLWVNNQLIIDRWQTQTASTENSATVELQAGMKYNIRMEYFNGSNANGVARLLWSSASTPKQLVPQIQLYPTSTGIGDITPPNAEVTSPNNDWSYKTLTQATGTASDSESGVQLVRGQIFRYSDSTYWNGTAWTANLADLPVQGTTSWTLGLPALSQGRYAVRVVVTDKVGLTSQSPWAPFYIDNIAPAITITRPTAGTQYSSIVSATGTAVDNGPGVAWVRGRLIRASDGFYWNGSVWQKGLAEVTAQGTEEWGYTFPALTPGNYSWQTVASDWGGNVSTSAVVNFTKLP